MDCTHLTPEQRRALCGQLSRHQEAIARIVKRMKSRGWFTSDAALNALVAAEASIQAARSSITQADKLPANQPVTATPFTLPMPARGNRIAR